VIRSSVIHTELVVAFATAIMFTRTRLNTTMQYTACIVVFFIGGSIHKNDSNAQTTRPSMHMLSFGVATNFTRSERNF